MKTFFDERIGKNIGFNRPLFYQAYKDVSLETRYRVTWRTEDMHYFLGQYLKININHSFIKVIDFTNIEDTYEISHLMTTGINSAIESNSGLPIDLFYIFKEGKNDHEADDISWHVENSDKKDVPNYPSRLMLNII